MYGTIVADPPWVYEGFVAGKGGRWADGTAGKTRHALPYAGMDFDAIAALPVARLAAADCRLFLWATNRYLRGAFDVAEAWGFDYRQTLVWHKTGNPTPFAGSLAPHHAEFLLVAVKGHPARLGTLASSVVPIDVNPAVLVHSQKPEAWLDHIEAVSPGPYLELFARRQRLGWDTWGDEALPHVELTTPKPPRNRGKAVGVDGLAALGEQDDA